jgi:hypothetical protein
LGRKALKLAETVTQLSRACMKTQFSGHVDTVAKLIKEGANINKHDTEGSTVVAIELKKGHGENASILKREILQI